MAELGLVVSEPGRGIHDDRSLDDQILGRALGPAAQPRSRLALDPDGAFRSVLSQAVSRRALEVSSSRCGSFAAALAVLAADPDLASLGTRLVSHRFHSNGGFGVLGIETGSNQIFDPEAYWREISVMARASIRDRRALRVFVCIQASRAGPD